MPAWGANSEPIEQFTSYVPADTKVLFLADASMRLHYPELSAAVEEAVRRHQGAEARSAVPSEYLVRLRSAPWTPSPFGCIRCPLQSCARLSAGDTKAPSTSRSGAPPIR